MGIGKYKFPSSKRKSTNNKRKLRRKEQRERQNNCPDQLARRCVDKIVQEGKLKSLWNQELDASIVNDCESCTINHNETEVQCSQLKSPTSDRNMLNNNEISGSNDYCPHEAESQNDCDDSNTSIERHLYNNSQCYNEAKSRNNSKELENKNNVNNMIISKLFTGLIFLSALFLCFLAFFKSKNKNDVSFKNDYKSCKERLRKMKILIKKLVKRKRKTIGRKRKNGHKISKVDDRVRVTKKYCNQFRDFIEPKLNGRRIVDFTFVWRAMRDELSRHDSKKCRLEDWQFHKETLFHGGLRSQFIFKCRRCNKECRIWSEGLFRNQMELCQASVLGTLVEGVGYTHTDGLLACMGLSYITDKTFKSHQEKLLAHLENISAESMRKANQEERRLAKEAGDVDKSGIPFITVIVDGSWLTRSYGNKYDSLSGLGAIIGQRTGKILYVGIKNKYCTKCYRAEKRDTKPKPHKCYRNFPLSSSSTLMESQALVEGFQQSISNHNVIYKYFVGDGDSNFHKSLIDANPYAKYDIVPRKIECTNHLLRNLCKKAKNVATITQKKNQRKKGFVTLRNMVKDNILKIRQTVINEVDQELMESNKTWNEKIKSLRTRILNIPSHVFGEHKRCKDFGYDCNANIDPTKKVVNYVPYLKAFNLYNAIEEPIKYLSNHSESLLHKVNNNIVESFNNIVAKEICGKRINLGCSNQYNTRVAIAVIQHNTQEVYTEIYKNMGKEIPDCLENLVTRRKTKVARTRIARFTNGRKRKYVFSKTDKNYGPKCEKPDLSPEQLTLLQEDHNKKLLDNQKDRINIEIQTRDQSNSDLWMSLRKHMLTASNFGRICRMRVQTSCSNLVKSLLFPTLNDTPAMAYGREKEDIARMELAKHLSKEIKLNGLFIDAEDPRFGASPDGLIDDDGIVEIKNPFSAKDLSPAEAMKRFPHLNFLDKRTNAMKKTHHWYYQIQGQLHITQRKYCMFALRTSKGLAIHRVERDDKFWEENMKPKLSSFYDHCLLPEILDSRFLRNMAIRDPPYVLEAKRKYEEKATVKRKNKAELKKEEVESDIFNINTITNNGDSNIKEAKISDTVSKKRTNPKCKSKNVDYTNNANIMPCENTIQLDLRKSCNRKVSEEVNMPKCLSVIKSKIENVSYDDDAVVYQGSYTDPDAFDSHAVNSIRKFLDTKGIITDINKYTNMILDTEAHLTDDVMDVFISIIEQNYNYAVQSTIYQYFLVAVEPVQRQKSIALLGGSCTNHWRLAYYDEATIRIYDTLPGYTGGKLVKTELNYILKRFPSINEKDITFVKIKTIQPDGSSCGIYAAALATYLILAGEPTNVVFSNNASVMRMHFLQILKKKELYQFPLMHA